jgi:hypothetical protein
MLQKALVIVALACASIGAVCDDDSAEQLHSAALRLVPPEAEIVEQGTCGESLMAGDCSVLYLDASWGELDERVAVFRETSQAAGWDVRDSVVKPGLILVLESDDYHGEIRLGPRFGRPGCSAHENPEACADVIFIDDK